MAMTGNREQGTADFSTKVAKSQGFSAISNRFTAHNSQRKAMTLAETLVVVLIIGVVATMTIPPLNNQIQNMEFKTKMKNEYSAISQAYQQIANDNGGSFVNALSTCSGNSNTCVKDFFKEKLSYIKDCNAGASMGVCFPAYNNIKYLNGKSVDSIWGLTSGDSGLVLKDGTSLIFSLDSLSCKMIDGNSCGWLSIDVNGLKAPNTWGKDIFIFFLYSNSIRPSIIGNGWGPNVDDCGTGTNVGYTCSSKYLLGN